MPSNTFDLSASAAEEMVRQGFQLDAEPGADEQVATLKGKDAAPDEPKARDLRQLPWSSIDNDTSRDLDQAEVAERVDGGVCVRVAIADVAVEVPKDSPLDRFAAQQTQTVYTAVRNFPMLPVALSTDLTSLNEAGDRMSVVTEFTVGAQGEVQGAGVYEALIRNAAQLAYSTAGAWLEGHAEGATKIGASAALQEQLRLQEEASKALHARRLREGALDFTRVEADPLVVDGQVQSLAVAQKNAATMLIEELMIATNETTARLLLEAKRSCIRRVVRSPERWPRIVELVKHHGTELPGTPDSGALNAFLVEQRKADPDHYPELALSIIKLMGPGEYVLSRADEAEQKGHFGLAARDYTHSTAPNRRYVDLVTQRLVKAMLAAEAAPYTDEELAAIAKHCTERESAARKVERAMQKREAAVALSGRVGSTFRGVITGASSKGVYVRVFQPPVEGRIVQQEQGLDVGDRVQVTLLRTDPQHAYIDFKRA
ncbi:MAG: RNB domain-containing ribonuclease [Acidobacteriaceae bacterium]